MLQLGIGGNKKKKKTNPNIEFVSPYLLEDCVWQLQNFPGVGEWFPVRTRAELVQVDDETWRFKIHKTYYDSNFLRRRGEKSSLAFITYFKIEADGYLRRTSANTTFVSGNTYVSKNTYLFHGFLAGFSLVIITVLLLSTKALKPELSATLYILALILLAAQLYNFIAADRQRFVRVLKKHITRVLGR